MNLFIITSVIHFDTSSGWSYAPQKSVYSSSERYNQTLKTIESIRQFSPNSKIALLEGSRLSEDEKFKFNQNVDLFFDYSNDEYVKKTCNSNRKGWGEISKLRKFINENVLSSYDRIFKISGRYWLTEKFDESKYSLDKNSFRKIKNSDSSVSTVLYSISKNYINDYKLCLDEIDKILTKDTIGIEILFYQFLENTIYIDILGVAGWVAVTPNEFYEF